MTDRRKLRMRVRLHEPDKTHRNKEGELTTLLQLRVPVTLVQRLDQYRATVPMCPTRQQTVRYIILKYFDELED
jgi:hypothetical protein